MGHFNTEPYLRGQAMNTECTAEAHQIEAAATGIAATMIKQEKGGE